MDANEAVLQSARRCLVGVRRHVEKVRVEASLSDEAGVFLSLMDADLESALINLEDALAEQFGDVCEMLMGVEQGLDYGELGG